MSMKEKLAKGVYKLVHVVSGGGDIGCYYLADSNNLLISLSPRNSKGEVIGPIVKKKALDAYWNRVLSDSQHKYKK